jgi:hypothetical protein
MKNIFFLKDKTASIGAYDPNQISALGNIRKRTINSSEVFGAGLTRFTDLQTPFSGAVVLTGVQHTASSGRQFTLSTFTAGVASVVLVEKDLVTGEEALIGRILITLPNQAATTHTPRFIRVIDAGLTGWKIFVGTIGSVALNGGAFLVNKVDRSDFSFGPPTFFMAIANDAKGVYMLQDPTLRGVAHAMTTIMGGGWIESLGQLVTAKGSAGSLSFDGFDVTVAPQVLGGTNTAPNVNGTASVFQHTAHGLVNNDMIVLTAAAPTGFSLTTGLAIQNVYFVRNATANTYELSLTSGGASILGTSVTTSSWVRAYGTSTNTYLASRKTGVIASGIPGVALLIDNQKIIIPADGPNAGVPSYFIATTTHFAHFPISGIVAGAISLPGTFVVNNLGNGIDYVAPTNVVATYSDVLGKIIYTSAAFGVFMKSWVNSNISHAFGTQINTWLENTGRTQDYFRGFNVAGLELQNGWIFITVGTVGQRGIISMDARSDTYFDYSKLITPVTYIGGPGYAQFITTIEELFDVTDTVSVRYRSASLSTDPVFASASGGWIDVDIAGDLSAIILDNYVQLEIKWDILSYLSGIPTQIKDLVLAVDLFSDMSEYFKGMAKGTTEESPSYTVYRQTKLYAVDPATLYHRGIDDAGNIVEAFNTTAHASQFTYSIDEGATWLPGKGPNQIGKRLRFARANPPGVIITNSIKES